MANSVQKNNNEQKILPSSRIEHSANLNKQALHSSSSKRSATHLRLQRCTLQRHLCPVHQIFGACCPCDQLQQCEAQRVCVRLRARLHPAAVALRPVLGGEILPGANGCGLLSMRVCVCVCLCLCVSMCVYVCAFVRVCLCTLLYVYLPMHCGKRTPTASLRVYKSGLCFSVHVLVIVSTLVCFHSNESQHNRQGNGSNSGSHKTRVHVKAAHGAKFSRANDKRSPPSMGQRESYMHGHTGRIMYKN